MVQRSFGPQLGAGVRIIEKKAEPSIQQSAFGSTALVGVFERGEVGKLIQISSKSDLLAKTGGFVPSHLAPDCAEDFWTHSEGAGQMFLYRVTDGTEKKATLTLLDRKAARNNVVRLDAKNGGGWGGRRQTWVADVLAADVADTTIQLPAGLHPIQQDQFKGGKVFLPDANAGAGGSYEIIGNDASDGTNKTTMTLAADAKAGTELGTPVDTTPEATIEVLSKDGFGQDKYLAAEVRDGVLNPSTEWGLFLYLNGNLVREYPDLSSDPMSDRYFVDVINEDGGNEYVTATDLWVGSITADVRPANHFGSVASGQITTTVLDLGTAVVLVDSSLAGANTIGTFTFGAKAIADRLEVTYNAGATAWDVASLDQMANHAFDQASGGVAYPADTDRTIGFTVTENTPANGEKFVLTVIPVQEGEAVGGRIYLPEVNGAAAGGYQIESNTETTATITSGDLTVGGTLAGNIKYRLEYKQQFAFGYDGIANLATANFLPAYDVANSPFNDIFGKGAGLVKFGTPGVSAYSGNVNSVTIEKAGIAYCFAKNHMYREEIPKTITDEFAAKAYVQDTLGKSNYTKVTFPSWATVDDPIRIGRRKDIPMSGAYMGREARSARNFEGYHKVCAGLNEDLPRVIKLPTGDRALNQEVLNPAGIQSVQIKGGRFVMWGARIPALDQSFKFAQHRESLSHYEHVLQENFEFIIFAINDAQDDPQLLASLQAYFLPEWRKRALRGNSFAEAAEFKIDSENNTDATRALGDKNAEIKLRLADTVERFNIIVSKAGVFETLGA